MKISAPENNKFLQKEEIEKIFQNNFNENSNTNDVILVNSSKEYAKDDSPLNLSAEIKEKPTLKKTQRSIDRSIDLEENPNHSEKSKEKQTILDDWLINSLAPAESSFQEKSFIDENENKSYRFEIERFIENKNLREILKSRRNAQKNEFMKKIERLVEKNNAEWDLFSDSKLLDSLMKNSKKINEFIQGK